MWLASVNFRLWLVYSCRCVRVMVCMVFLLGSTGVYDELCVVNVVYIMRVLFF